MDDKNKMEEFNSTEINIESDTSDDWEFMSEFEVDTYSVPYLSVPKMHEFVAESDTISYRKSTEIDRQIQHNREREIKDEDKQEHLPLHKQYKETEKLRREINKTMQTKSFQSDHGEENEKVIRDIDDVMQDKFFQHRQGQDDAKVRRAISEAMQDLSQNERENYRVRREMEEAMQDLSQNEQENYRVRREMEEAMQDLSQNDQENDRVRREMEEAMQDLHQNDKKNDRVRRGINEAIQDAPQNEHENDRVRSEIGEAMQDNAFQDTYSVPYLSFSKMHEFVEESNLISYGKSIGNDKQSEQGIFSQHDREERKNEGKEEQFHRHEQYEENEKLLRQIDEAVQNKYLQYEQEQGNETVKRAIDETLQDVPQNEQENETVKREIDETLQDVSQNEQENETVKRGIDETLQDVPQNEQENETVKKAIDETLQDVPQNEQENECDQREMEEAINEIHDQHKQERRNRSLTCLDQQSESKIKMEFPTTRQQLKLFTKTSAVLLEEQADRKLCEKVNTPTQENTYTPSAALCGKSQIHADECESLAKAGSKKPAVQREFFERIHKILEFNFVLPDKVSTEVARVNKSEREKDLSVKISSKDAESFRNEELDNPSSDKEKKKADKFSKEEND